MENQYFVDRPEGPFRQGDFVPFQADQAETGAETGTERETKAEGEPGDDYPHLKALLDNRKRHIQMTVAGTAIDDRRGEPTTAHFDTQNTRGRRIVPNGASIKERWRPVYEKFMAWRTAKGPKTADIKDLFPADKLCDPAYVIPDHLDKGAEEERIQSTRTMYFLREFARFVGDIDADALKNPNDRLLADVLARVRNATSINDITREELRAAGLEAFEHTYWTLDHGEVPIYSALDEFLLRDFAPDREQELSGKIEDALKGFEIEVGEEFDLQEVIQASSKSADLAGDKRIMVASVAGNLGSFGNDLRERFLEEMSKKIGLKPKSANVDEDIVRELFRARMERLIFTKAAEVLNQQSFEVRFNPEVNREPLTFGEGDVKVDYYEYSKINGRWTKAYAKGLYAGSLSLDFLDVLALHRQEGFPQGRGVVTIKRVK